jgi:hypothetical protein
MITIVKLLITFGPDVIELIGDIVKAIAKAGHGRDRKAAERLIYLRGWAKQHGLDPDALNGTK